MTKEKTVSKIIEIKEFNKEQLESEVRREREKLSAEQIKLDGLDCEYKKTIVSLACKQSGPLQAPEIELFHTYLKHLAKQIDQQKSVVAAQAAEVDKKQRDMVEAFKEQCLFEKLRDRIIEERIKELSQSEQKESDFAFLCRRTGK